MAADPEKWEGLTASGRDDASSESIPSEYTMKYHETFLVEHEMTRPERWKNIDVRFSTEAATVHHEGRGFFIT